MKPPLNWREIAIIAEWIAPKITGMFIDRIVVPERPEFPDGFLKHEWSIRLTARSGEAALIFGVRPNQPTLEWIPRKGPKAASGATRSGFDLSLNKTLSGRKVSGFTAVERERTMILWAEGGYGLVLTLIPALPEALLISASPGDAAPGKTVPILGRSRSSLSENETYAFPDGAGSPPGLTLRAEGLRSLEDYSAKVRETLDSEAFELRLLRVRRRIAQDLKQAETRHAQNTRTAKAAQKESDYRHLGDLLKSVMGMNPPLNSEMKRSVLDWETGAETLIACDPKLDLKGQVEKFYSLAKRKERRIVEADLRLQALNEKISKLEELRAAVDRVALSVLRGHARIDELAPFEARLGLTTGEATTAETKAVRGKASGKGGWSGKTFLSKEGLPILVGRSKDENLELTFKFARGNDLWMHVRGKPGAHVVIPLRDKKNASLETLLDAAYLCLHYSGGSEWGKTEVDYAPKKHVKRIRDSSEASYVNNKTLIVEVDRARLNALLGQEII